MSEASWSGSEHPMATGEGQGGSGDEGDLDGGCSGSGLSMLEALRAASVFVNASMFENY